MSRAAILEREGRLGPRVALLAGLPLALYVAALVIEQSVGLEVGGLLTEELRSIEANSGAVLAAAIVRGLAFLSMAVPLVFLYRAAQARSDRVQGAFIGFAVLGPVLLAIQGIVTYVAQLEIARQFIDRSPAVGDVYTLAENLVEESSGRQVASGLLFAGVLAMIFAMVYTPLWATRTGLLTRFFGTLGMALGASLLFILQVALLAILVWFAWLGLIIANRVPGGRPPAWDAGEAIPWLRPGEEPAVALAGNGDVVEGDASEIPGVGENPNAARRERAKKRKRKRRTP